MSNQSSNITFCKKHLEAVYVSESFATITEHFQKTFPYRAEFGYALGAAGVKLHATNWCQIFKIKEIDVIIKHVSDESITCEYIELVEQRTIFKSILPTEKTVEVKGYLHMGINGQTITHYSLQKDIKQLVLELVEFDTERYNKAIKEPIFKTPYSMHIDVIKEHLKQNKICATTSQIKYLSGYFWGAICEASCKLFGMQPPKNPNCKQEIETLFRCSNQSQVCDMIKSMHLEELLSAVFSFLVKPDNLCGNTFGSNNVMSSVFTDNSKYLL